MKKNRKMVTLKHLAVGASDWEGSEDQARIERNLFLRDGGEPWEALRFGENRNGRHNRVHLVIKEGDFVDWFRSAVENGVFGETMLCDLRGVLGDKRDSFHDVTRAASDGKLTANIDSQLYGDEPA
jgi:hypothetical protein